MGDSAARDSGSTGGAHAIILPDGRTLHYRDYGPRDGAPILYCHGFPSSSAEAQLLGPVLSTEGARLIAPDRPGYGGSSPLARRTLKGYADDVRVLLDRLSVARVAVLGVSGGGPYALSLLAGLPDRVSAGALVAALGPPAVLQARRGDFIGPLRAALWAVGARPGLAPWLAPPVMHLMRWREGLNIPVRFVSPADRLVLADPTVRAVLRAAQREGLCQGPQAAAQDLLLYVRSWGFAWTDIGPKLALWHGQADRVVPAAVSVAMSRLLPGARLCLRPGEGHYSLAVREGGAVIRALSSDGGRS